MRLDPRNQTQPPKKTSVFPNLHSVLQVLFSYSLMELCGSGINKEHQMCSKTFGYERIKDLSENVFRVKKISRWRLMWRKIMMGMKNKKKDQILDHGVRYDPLTYSQNFENIGTIAYHEDPDVSSKSFSARFVSSSKVFNVNYV